MPLFHNYLTFLEAASVIKFILVFFYIWEIINTDTDVSDIFENVMFFKA